MIINAPSFGYEHFGKEVKDRVDELAELMLMQELGELEDSSEKRRELSRLQLQIGHYERPVQERLAELRKAHQQKTKLEENI